MFEFALIHLLTRVRDQNVVPFIRHRSRQQSSPQCIMPRSSNSTSKPRKGSKGGAKGWATPEQLDFLQELVPTYIARRTEGRSRLTRFWIKLFNDWFTRWPDDCTDKEKPKRVCIVVQS